MHKQWQAVEEESARLMNLLHQGTDASLAHALDSLSSEHLQSAVTHIAKNGNTVFHTAVVRERIDSVKIMLRNNVDVNAKDGDGNSPLYCCLCHKCLTSAQLLISHGADVNELVSRVNRETLLHRMIKGDRGYAVELLLESGAALEAVTIDGDTPLHFAARYNRPKMARLLADSGAEINTVNAKMETPLHVAITNKSMDVAKVLVKRKASVTAKDRHGMTALHSAVAISAVELVRLMLINNSTQINSKETLLGRTPLLLACSNSNQKMATLLLSHGADANLTTNYRKSVLHVAACSGNANVLGAVMKHTTNVNALTLNNKTPLHCAVLEGHSDVAKALLRSGVNVNMKDIDGNTALHMASRAGNTGILTDLLHHGGQVNVTNMEQQTPLHVAFMMGHEETGWILIQAGADEDLLDIHETTPRTYLEEFRRKQEADEREALELHRKNSRVRFHGLSQNTLQEIFEEDEALGKVMEVNNNNNGDVAVDIGDDAAQRQVATTESGDEISDQVNGYTPSSEDNSILGQVLSELTLTNGVMSNDSENEDNGVEDKGDNDDHSSNNSGDDEGANGSDAQGQDGAGAEGEHRRHSRHRRKSSKSRTPRDSHTKKHSKTKSKHKTSIEEDKHKCCGGSEGGQAPDGHKCQAHRKRKLGVITAKHH